MIETALQQEYAARRVRTVDEQGRAYATGKRKTSVARVWIWEGPGTIQINGRALDMCFPQLNRRAEILSPFQVSSICALPIAFTCLLSHSLGDRPLHLLKTITQGMLPMPSPCIPFRNYILRSEWLLQVTNTLGFFNVWATVKGGGNMGQSQALRHGISCALQKWDPDLRLPLRQQGYLTRDPRVVERKKPGRAKARKAFQWVKR